MRKPGLLIKLIGLLLFIYLEKEDSWAQNDLPVSYITITPKAPVDKSSWCVVEEPASFPGGIVAWTKYLSDSTQYPELLVTREIETIVKIQFILSKEGWPTEIIALNTLKTAFTNEAIRVIKGSPKWKPAMRNGRVCSCRMVQGFRFVWTPPAMQKTAVCNDSNQLNTLLL